MSLLSSLALAGRSLEAQHRGIEAVGQNIANVNTPGYTKRVVEMQAVPPSDGSGIGRGVEASSVRAMRDVILDRRVLQELPSQEREAAIGEVLSVVEAGLGDTGDSIDAKLTAFFDAFSSLSEDPQSPVARFEAQFQGKSLATAFNNMSQGLTAAARDVDAKVRGEIEKVNSLTERIANLNASLSRGGTDGTALHLQDEQTLLVRELSSVLDIDVTDRSGGGVDVTFGNGRPLVVGNESYDLTTSSTPPSGFAAIVSSGATVTSEITSGRLGGLLQARDVTVPAYMNRLDTLASDTVAQVNAIHTAGFDQAGAAAGDFFAYSTPPVGVAGAAAAMTLDAAVAASTSAIAAGSTNAAGDNNTARAIANLRDAKVLSGGTTSLQDSWGQLVYRVAHDTQTAKNEQKTATQIVQQIDELRDQVSGISLDEEAMSMLKYQRAYEANARFFNAVNSALDILFQTLGA